MNPTAVPREIPRTARYLGDDRSGAEFWLAGPHVFSVPAQARRTRPVCSVASFNRLQRCRRGSRAARFSISG